MRKAVLASSNGMRRGSKPSSSSRGNRTAESSFARGTRTYSMTASAIMTRIRSVRVDGGRRRRRKSLEGSRGGVVKKGGTNFGCRQEAYRRRTLY